jgi:hypothetical protein
VWLPAEREKCHGSRRGSDCSVADHSLVESTARLRMQDDMVKDEGSR